eukprot:scaffold290043_cov33-Tisochrysis_lutea.AAC.1
MLARRRSRRTRPLSLPPAAGGSGQQGGRRPSAAAGGEAAQRRSVRRRRARRASDGRARPHPSPASATRAAAPLPRTARGDRRERRSGSRPPSARDLLQVNLTPPTRRFFMRKP